MATLLGVLALLLWGILALLGTVTADVPAFQLLSLCFFTSALIMPIKRLINGKRPIALPKLTKLQWLFGIVGLFGFHFCYFVAIKFAPAIEVSLIVYSWPLLLTLFVSTAQTRLSALVGGMLGFTGIAFIVLGGRGLSLNSEYFSGHYFSGYVLAMICPIIWSSYSWFLTHSKSDVDDVGWLSLVVSLLALLAHGYFEADQSTWHFNMTQWVGIVLLGIGPVGGAFYLWEIALKRGNQALLASLSFGTPLMSSVILSFAGLNTWSINIVIALGLILFGAIVANKNLLGWLTRKTVLQAVKN